MSVALTYRALRELRLGARYPGLCFGQVPLDFALDVSAAVEPLREAYAVVGGIPAEHVNMYSPPRGLAEPYVGSLSGGIPRTSPAGWLARHPFFRALGLRHARRTTGPFAEDFVVVNAGSGASGYRALAEALGLPHPEYGGRGWLLAELLFEQAPCEREGWGRAVFLARVRLVLEATAAITQERSVELLNYESDLRVPLGEGWARPGPVLA